MRSRLRKFAATGLSLFCFFPSPLPGAKADSEHRSSSQNLFVQPQDPKDDIRVKIDTTLVTVPVIVMDRDGRYISKLQRSDFKLFENGVEQAIDYFASVDEPFQIALVLDTSASTVVSLPDIKSAASSFLDQLRDHDQAMLVSFADRIHKYGPPTNDREKWFRALNRLRTGAGTRLYDAVDWTLNKGLKPVTGRKAIILLTDGVDTESRSGLAARNLRDAQESNVPIYIVQYNTYDHLKAYQDSFDAAGARVTITGFSKKAYAFANDYLKELAEQSGGRLFQAEKIEDVSQAMNSIAEELRRQYTLGYYPNSGPLSDARRSIKVQLEKPGLVVRARKSYVRKAGH